MPARTQQSQGQAFQLPVFCGGHAIARACLFRCLLHDDDDDDEDDDDGDADGDDDDESYLRGIGSSAVANRGSHLRDIGSSAVANSGRRICVFSM